METSIRPVLILAALSLSASAAAAQAPRDGGPSDSLVVATAVAAAPAAPGAGATLRRAALDQVVHAAGGALVGSGAAGALTLVDAVFDSDGITMSRVAARDLARAGRALRDAGAARLRVVIWAAAAGPAPDLPSRRAAAVARGLARGGYPPSRMALEVAPRPTGEASGWGRVVALGR